MAIGAVGIIALVSAPLSQATVRSPSRPVAKNTSSTASKQTRSPADQSANKKKTLPKVAAPAPLAIRSANCTTSVKMRPGLAGAASSQLRKLAQYEQACASTVANQLSFFVPTPTTAQEARDYAADVAVRLREFAAYGISPLVFFEPTTGSGLVNLANYRAGNYDPALDAYFAAIKNAGITDVMMGTWVPLPEANIPVWTSLDPNDFAGCVVKAVTYQKKYFPASKASVMLDTITYPTAGSWSGGRAISLLPYVQNLPAGLIDSVGLQGFPWSPAANESGPTNGGPRDYLRVELAAEAARALHVKDVWLNTGTFGVKYAGSAATRVTISPEQRLVLLTEVIARAKTLQAQGLKVSIHLFAEDKSRVAEATDWSYWPNGQVAASPSTYAFKAFAHDLQAAGIPLWLFDAGE